MKILVFDTDEAVRTMFSRQLSEHELVFVEESVSRDALLGYSDAEMVSVFVSSRLTREDMQLLPSLHAVITRSSGVDHIDMEYVKEKGITLYSVPHYGAHTVAEYTFALLLALTRRIPASLAQMSAGVFQKAAELEGDDLYGKTIGVIGTGAIGANVTLRAQAFGMKVLMYDLYPNKALESDAARYAPLDELYLESDIITLHTPETPATHHLVSEEAFGKMKDGVIIVNTARGELIDTKALLESLRSGKVSRAALDVLEGERELREGSANETTRALITEFAHDSKRLILTPHIAFFTREAYHEILRISVENVREFLRKTSSNV